MYLVSSGGSAGLGTVFEITKTSSGVAVSDSDNEYTFPASRWAIVPNANGPLGSYINGASSIAEGTYRVFAGGLLGVYAYDDINSEGYDLDMIVSQTDDTLYGASWRSAE